MLDPEKVGLQVELSLELKHFEMMKAKNHENDIQDVR